MQSINYLQQKRVIYRRRNNNFVARHLLLILFRRNSSIFRSKTKMRRCRTKTVTEPLKLSSSNLFIPALLDNTPPFFNRSMRSELYQNFHSSKITLFPFPTLSEYHAELSNEKLSHSYILQERIQETSAPRTGQDSNKNSKVKTKSDSSNL